MDFLKKKKKKNHMDFLKKSVAFEVPPAYSRYRRLRPPGGKFVSFVLNSQGI